MSGFLILLIITNTCFTKQSNNTWENPMQAYEHIESPRSGFMQFDNKVSAVKDDYSESSYYLSLIVDGNLIIIMM